MKYKVLGRGLDHDTAVHMSSNAQLEERVDGWTDGWTEGCVDSTSFEPD